MIKVLHIITDKNIGGAGHQLLALLENMDKNGFQAEVILPEGSRLTPALAKRGTVCTEAPHLADKSFSLPAVKCLFKYIKEKRPDIVHTHAAFSGRIAARLYRKCRIIHTRHSVFPVSKRQRLFGFINNFLSDAVIAVSPAARENLLALGLKTEKINIIYNGTVKTEEYNEDEKNKARKKYGIPPNAFVLAQIARLSEIKGQDYTLDAARELGSDFLFLLAGDGPRKEHLENRIKEEKIDNVKLLGFIEAIEDIFNIMDVQINASYGTEATSLALVSGMSLGKPAIAADYGGNPYVIEEGRNGILIPVKDAEALRAAVLKLRNDTALYRELSLGSQKRYAERFTAKEMAEKTEGLYREVLKIPYR